MTSVFVTRKTELPSTTRNRDQVRYVVINICDCLKVVDLWAGVEKVLFCWRYCGQTTVANVEHLKFIRKLGAAIE